MARQHLWLCALAVGAVGCGTSDPTNQLKPGDDDFVTIERDSSGAVFYDRAGYPAAGQTGTGGKEAPSGRTGTVEEADIYRVDGARLFYLNTYRGFIAYDLTDPSQPQRVSRLPIHGYPVEMFVTPTTVYALLRDALYVTQDATGLRFNRHNVSQMVAIDITDLRNPRVLTTTDIVGELREGVSRKIDDTIYVVSHLPQSYYYPGYPYGGERTEQAWVYSFNVANPASPRLVERLKVFEGGSFSASGGGTYSGRHFNGVQISATANTLHVVENWNSYQHVSGNPYTSCGASQYFQEAVVSVIDISDPTGRIRLHSRFSTYGALTDQFKNTYVFDAATRRGYYLGIFAREEWSSVNCTGRRFIRNALEAWDVTEGASPVKVSSLAFGKPNETVRGTTFDADRSIAFAITAERVDPLYAISYRDPRNPVILSAIDGLSGDMSVFRLVGNGQFLIGIGRDNSSDCTGFGTPTTGWSTNMAVSVIDVRNPAATRLVQRKCVTVNNASWVWSEINWNLDQAHKMIGLSTDARASVVSVPVGYYARTPENDGWWWYRPEAAVGLMSFDLAAYDPAKPVTEQRVLVNHATVVHPRGHVRRSIVFTHPNQRRLMVNLSDTHVGVVDIDNLDAPVNRSVIEVAPYHNRVFRFGDYLVDEVSLGGEGSFYSQGAAEFRVKLARQGVDEATPVTSFTMSRVEQVVQFRDLLVLFRRSAESLADQDLGIEAVVVDFANPAQPVQRAVLSLPTRHVPYVRFGCLGWFWWPYSGEGEWTATDEGLGLLTSAYSTNSVEQSLVFLNLSDPVNPRVNSRVIATQTFGSRGEMQGRRYLSLVGHGSALWANAKEQVRSITTPDGTTFAVMKSSAVRFDAQLNRGVEIALPGVATRIWGSAGAERFLATDTAFAWRSISLSSDRTQSMWVADQRYHLLSRAGSRAVLRDTRSFEGGVIGDMVGDGHMLYLTVRNGSEYGWWFRGGGWWFRGDGLPIASRAGTNDQLIIIDLGLDTLRERFSAPIGHWGSQLVGIAGHQLFVNVPGDGMLAVDVSNPDAPIGQHFARTLGWATHVAFTTDRAFVAAGNFGIFEMDLTAPPSIVRQ